MLLWRQVPVFLKDKFLEAEALDENYQNHKWPKSLPKGSINPLPSESI